MNKLIILFFLFYIETYSYNFLNKAYTLEVTTGLGLGNSYIISDISKKNLIDFDGNIIPNFYLDSEIVMLETVGLYFSNRTIYEFGKTILENNFSFGLSFRPFFAIRLLKNYFTDDYYKEFFYNSISFHIGGVIRYLTFSKTDKDNLNLLGIQLGISTKFLLSHTKNSDLFLKLGYRYNFIEKTEYYNMDGFFYFISIGLNFRFGDSIDWITGTDPNEEIEVKFEN